MNVTFYISIVASQLKFDYVRSFNMIFSSSSIIFRICQVSGLMPFKVDFQTRIPTKSRFWFTYTSISFLLILPPFLKHIFKPDINFNKSELIESLRNFNIYVLQILNVVTIAESLLHHSRQMRFLTSLNEVDAFLNEKLSIRMNSKIIEKNIFFWCIIPSIFLILITTSELRLNVDNMENLQEKILLIFLWIQTAKTYYPYFYQLIAYCAMIERRQTEMNENLKKMLKDTDKVKTLNQVKVNRLLKRIQNFREGYAKLYDCIRAFSRTPRWGIPFHILVNFQFITLDLYGVCSRLLKGKSAFIDEWSGVFMIIYAFYHNAMIFLSFHKLSVEVTIAKVIESFHS